MSPESHVRSLRLTLLWPRPCRRSLAAATRRLGRRCTATADHGAGRALQAVDDHPILGADAFFDHAASLRSSFPASRAGTRRLSRRSPPAGSRRAGRRSRPAPPPAAAAAASHRRLDAHKQPRHERPVAVLEHAALHCRARLPVDAPLGKIEMALRAESPLHWPGPGYSFGGSSSSDFKSAAALDG